MITTIKKNLAQGRFQQVIKQVGLALKETEDPKEIVELKYLVSVASRLSGKLEEAISSNKSTLEINPEHARTFQELGHCHKALNQSHEAAKYFYKATQFNPALIVSWQFLKDYYQQTQNFKALSLAEKQVSRLSALPKPVLGARDLMYEGALQQADAVCRQFLSTNKHHPEAMTLLGEIGICQKAFSEAEFVLESCITLYPTQYFAGLEYIKLLNQIGKFNKSLPVISELLTHFPGDKPMLLAKAGALSGIGQVNEAIDLYQKLLQEDEQQPFISLLLGHALKANGQYPEAIKAYQKAWQIKPDFGDAYWSLANTKTYRFENTELDMMQHQLKAVETAVNDKIHLHFALGKALEDQQNFDASFHHYQQGNTLKQQQLNFDVSTAERQIERQIISCNQTLFDSLSDTGCNDPSAIFIVGLPRAGSTLLEQILSSHSQVEGTMELHNILSLVSKLRAKSNAYPENLAQLDKKYFARFGQQYIDETRIYRSDKPYFIDKMPNNFMHIGLVKLILPQAKIIDARRNPMDCCFSGYKQLFAEGQEFTYNLENIARYYQAYEKIMAHWDEVLPGFVLRVQHEDVVEDLEDQVHRILDFCGLPFESGCLSFYETRRSIKTPSSEQVRQPINRAGMDKWRHFEAHLRPLLTAFGKR